MKYVFYLIILALLSLAVVVFSGCGQPATVSGDAPEISDEYATITFTDTGSRGSVTFTHRAHAGYLNNACLECHIHTGIQDDSIWNCNTCHSAEDTEGRCTDDGDGHDCWMVQCKNCHATLTPNPTPSPPCTSCHSF